ncbi:MAG: hypothetical protein ACYDEY_16025 [Acidimicrobiales bacterium]
MNNACHEARAAGRSRLRHRKLKGFLEHYDALVTAALAANPKPVEHKRDYLERKSYDLAATLEKLRCSRGTCGCRSRITTRKHHFAWQTQEDKRLLPSRGTRRVLRDDPLLHRDRWQARARGARCPWATVPTRRLDATRDNMTTLARVMRDTAEDAANSLHNRDHLALCEPGRALQRNLCRLSRG